MIRQSDYENYDYRQFWQDSKRDYEDNSERLVIRKFLKDAELGGKVFADLGCGYGRLFGEYKNCRKAILVDYSLKNLRNAKERISGYLKDDKSRLSDILFVVADVNELPFRENIIDVCLTVRVVHHINDTDKFFSGVSRILKPGGLFLVEFANKRNLKNILKFISGRLKVSPFGKEPVQIGETILNYHPEYIKSRLQEAGFYISKKISASNFRLGFLKKHFSLKILLFFENLYQDIFSFTDTGPSIFLKTILKDLPDKGMPHNYKKSSDATDNFQHLKFQGSGKDYLHGQEQIFKCPSCRMENLKIREDIKLVHCEDCGKEFPIIDGIYVLKN